MVARIFIDGEAGTTGLQIRERLALRRDLELVSIDPSKRKDQAAKADILNSVDVAILCLPDAAAKESVSLITNGRTRVIDASSAHRVDENWTYGFAEMTKGQADKIANARFVSNPGCYPQGVIAFMRPLIDAGVLPADLAITVNAISGYSGGGRQLIEQYEQDSAPNTYLPYGLQFHHKHLPEMLRYSKLDARPIFMPAVGNYAQGMMDCIPLQLNTLSNTPTGAELHAALADHYAQVDGFVELAPLESLNKSDALNPQRLNGTNRMSLHVFADDELGQAILISVYDNLGKGASGAAVQNLNLMLGIDQFTSLDAVIA